MKVQHLILFDDTCSLCLGSIAKIRKWDRKKQFAFAPLLSARAKHTLKHKWDKFKNANTLVLIENEGVSQRHRIWIKGRAVMRILWLIGGWRKIPGFLAYLPLGIDSIYTFIAKHRHRF